MNIIHGIWRGCNVAAIMDRNGIADLFIESTRNPNLVGGIANGKITQVKAGGLACFVDLPNGAKGFLQSRTPRKAGDVLPVQVSAYATGDKAWPLSTELKLTAPNLIRIINGKDIGVSQRLPSDKADIIRQKLKDAKLPGGYIVRSAAADVPPSVLLEQAQELAAITLADSAPGEWLLPPPSVLARAQQELPNGGLGMETEQLGETTLDDLLSPLIAHEITFGNGSAITLSPTAALLAIDVDSGGAASPSAVNRDAARLIAGALRNRNLGGQIVIDFCRDRDGRNSLLTAFGKMLADDPLSVAFHGQTKMGLVEASRPRLGPSLWEALDA